MTSLTEQRKPLLQVNSLKKYYTAKSKASYRSATVKAVDDVSFTIYEGETYGLVGESGCGKSTLGKTLLRLTDATDGQVLYREQDLNTLSRKQLRSFRQELQMVFQDPYSSLNPRIIIGHALEEPLIIHNVGSPAERTEQVLRMLNIVGLQEEHYYSLPHQLSGGQRQRIGLARALILNPKLVICDEPVSALDVIIQSQIINLMKKLQADLNLTYLFIAHDIGVVRHISDRIGVMYLGKLVEEADTDTLFENPLHPYTKLLLSAVPIPDPSMKKEFVSLETDIPSPLDVIPGCTFHTRCPFANETCTTVAPIKREVESGHYVACHLA